MRELSLNQTLDVAGGIIIYEQLIYVPQGNIPDNYYYQIDFVVGGIINNYITPGEGFNLLTSIPLEYVGEYMNNMDKMEIF